MNASLDDLKDFAENLMAVCNHQVQKNRPLSKISIDILAKQFIYRKQKNNKQNSNP
ncbi:MULTISPECIES: hypothetical protein [Methylophaga]|jgi:hypothetical protein|uniref:Uncharacterized protein n=1 Tax=Methylophaga aminisulfidivorans MP TaxID=1026882 RepID=F5T0L9_9GAMM|nr:MULTISPECIES: hypothetical protein [Methylophaga]EGL53870.1 hypothetical protein MAMP_00122 [Methylophaga aminisulfidivorans MP]|tara:strand:- start:312 stop:479 length:168 start_codon:yes stop_codon:yes gene_type:complete